MRLHFEDNLFGAAMLVADDPESTKDAIAALADAILEHGRMTVDAAEKIAAALQKESVS